MSFANSSLAEKTGWIGLIGIRLGMGWSERATDDVTGSKISDQTGK